MTWLNNLARRWWPFVATLAAGMVIYTMGYVVLTVAEDRAQLREQRDDLAAQSQLLADIIEQNTAEDEGRERRVGEALTTIETLFIDHFAAHDENVSLKLNDLLGRIAALLGRPAGVPEDRVSADIREGPAPAPGQAPAPAPATTTTTSPGQSDPCDRKPNASQCKGK